jgi:hypothetical protein
MAILAVMAILAISDSFAIPLGLQIVSLEFETRNPTIW